MDVKKIFTQDLQIAKSLIDRDEMVTRKYFWFSEDYTKHFFQKR